MSPVQPRPGGAVPSYLLLRGPSRFIQQLSRPQALSDMQRMAAQTPVSSCKEKCKSPCLYFDRGGPYCRRVAGCPSGYRSGTGSAYESLLGTLHRPTSSLTAHLATAAPLCLGEFRTKGHSCQVRVVTLQVAWPLLLETHRDILYLYP